MIFKYKNCSCKGVKECNAINQETKKKTNPLTFILAFTLTDNHPLK